MKSDPSSFSALPSASPLKNEDELDIGQLLASLWGGRWAIAVFTLIFCLLGILYLIAAKPIYIADGLVQVEQDSQSMKSATGDLATLFGAPMETEAEIQILQSRMVLNKVIDNLGLLIDVEPKYFPIFGAFVARKRNTDDTLAPPLFGQSGYAWSSESLEIGTFEIPSKLEGETFTVTALGDNKYVLSDSAGNKLITGVVGQLENLNSTTKKISVFVKELRAQSGTRFSLVKWSRADVLAALESRLKVSEQGKQSGIIVLTVEGPSPSYVTNVVKQVQDAYVRQNVERRSAEAAQSLDFLQQQLPEIKARVDAAQTKLNTYQQKQGSVDVTKETELVLEQSVNIEAKRLELMGQRQQAIQRFTPQHPVVQALDGQIKALESEQDYIKKRTETLPETQQEVLSLMRDLEVNTQLYTTLLNSAQALQVAKAGTVGNVRIIDYPMPPADKAKPNAALVLLGCLLVGVFLGITFVLLQRVLLRGVDNPDEVERLFGMPTYAAIPYTISQKKLVRTLGNNQLGHHVLAETEPDNVAIEAIRSLRTSLQFALLESSNNIIALTGPTPGLGKSFVSINLATVLASGGKRVALVDGDLRRGRIHRHFDQSAEPGLSDYILGKSDAGSVIRKTELVNLTLISNGTTPPNPSELLLHERLRELLEKLSEDNDFVIIDTPPVLPVTDASLIGRLAGCVLLVLKEGAHPMRMIEETVRRLRNAGINPKGTIFNQVGVKATGYYGYYHSGYGYSYKNKYGSEKR